MLPSLALVGVPPRAEKALPALHTLIQRTHKATPFFFARVSISKHLIAAHAIPDQKEDLSLAAF